MRRLITILLLILYLQTFGDTGPKHAEHISIHFLQHGNRIEFVDSIYIIVASGSSMDTAFLPPYTTTQFWTRPTLSKDNDHYVLFSHGDIKSFKIITLKGPEKIESNFLANYPGRSVYFIERDESKSVVNRKEIYYADKSPLLHQYWKVYFFYLLLTIIVEFLSGLIFFYKNRTDQRLISFFILLAFINALTHFSLWYFYSHAYIPLLLPEAGVVIVECCFWKTYFHISTKKAVLISMLVNFASWATGAIISIFI